MANDIQIIAVICGIFILIGILLPFIQDDFGVEQTSYSANPIIEEMEENEGTLGNVVLGWRIFGSVFSMFFWTFGALPFWLDAMFIILRLVLGVTIARNIWVGGGS